jgi:hypothetical protein
MEAKGEYGSHTPIAIINKVVSVMGTDAMLPKKGIF